MGKVNPIVGPVVGVPVGAGVGPGVGDGGEVGDVVEEISLALLKPSPGGGFVEDSVTIPLPRAATPATTTSISSAHITTYRVFVFQLVVPWAACCELSATGCCCLLSSCFSSRLGAEGPS